MTTRQRVLLSFVFFSCSALFFLMVSAGTALDSWAHLLSRSGTWFTAGHSGSAASASSTAVSRFGPVYLAASSDLSFRLRISVYGSTSLRTGRWQRLFLQQFTNNRSHCIFFFFFFFLLSSSQGRRLGGGRHGVTTGRLRGAKGHRSGQVGLRCRESGGSGDGNLLFCLICLLGRVWVVL